MHIHECDVVHALAKSGERDPWHTHTQLELRMSRAFCINGIKRGRNNPQLIKFPFVASGRCVALCANIRKHMDPTTQAIDGQRLSSKASPLKLTVRNATPAECALQLFFSALAFETTMCRHKCLAILRYLVNIISPPPWTPTPGASQPIAYANAH